MSLAIGIVPHQEGRRQYYGVHQGLTCLLDETVGLLKGPGIFTTLPSMPRNNSAYMDG